MPCFLLHHRIALLLALYNFLAVTHCAPAPVSTNDTVVLPPGASNHGIPNLLCLPAKWTTIAAFFLGNYIAHAATVVSRPGSSPIDTTIAVIMACLLPGSGLTRALSAIISGSRLTGDELRAAARAGALCTLLKLPSSRVEELYNLFTIIDRKGFKPLEPAIHGFFDMPEDYYLVVLPRDAKFEPLPAGKKIKLCSNYNVVKVLIALAQVVYAITTLYRTKGDQITRFGYAAFGLTVIPYLFMSIMNLIGNLMRPDYPTMYLIESQDMVDAVVNRAYAADDKASTADEKTEPADQSAMEHQGTSGNGHNANDTDQKADEKLDTTSQTTAADRNANTAIQSVIVSQDANKAKQNAESSNHDTHTAVQSIEVGTRNCTPDNTPAQHSVTTRTTAMYIGTVAKLTPAYEAMLLGLPTSDQDVENDVKQDITILSWPLSCILGILVPIAIIGIMTHFHKGDSTLPQRVWVMLWVNIGGFAGGYVGAMFWMFTEKKTLLSIYCVIVLLALLLCVPAIGGFVVVSQEISSYGDCQYL